MEQDFLRIMSRGRMMDYKGGVWRAGDRGRGRWHPGLSSSRAAPTQAEKLRTVLALRDRSALLRTTVL